jgi:hypothetical protein
MLRKLLNLAWMASLALGLQSASAFSLLGPNNEVWQVPDIGYNPLPFDGLPTAPKNISEEYRRNVPVLYYSFDANFLEFFGSNGVYAVEQAMQILNSVTNVSSYSKDLSEFPLAVTRENPTATALSLVDLKSVTLHLMMEQLGLAEPERYTWTLHDRVVGPGGCPADVEYLTVQRNFDITPTPLDQYQASSYVNGTLYSYYILEYCASPPGPPLGEAVEVSVDPLDNTFTAVASDSSSTLAFGQGANNKGLTAGKYYLGLTRDDVAGLRYLLREKNMNWESPGPTSLSLITNTQPQLLFTSNLTELASFALTNDAATVQGQFPGLTVVSSTNWFETSYVDLLVPAFTNYPYDPVGTAPHLILTTVRTLQVQQKFKHTFDNLKVVVYTNGVWTAMPVSDLSTLNGYGIETFEQVSGLASGSPYSPATGFAVTTNVTRQSWSTNEVVGEFLLLPTNSCDVVLLAPQLTFTNIYSNLVASITSTFTATNANTGTSTNITETYTASLFTYSTNHAFSALPITCLQSNVALIGGIEKVSFVRRDFDSLLGRFFTPITNNYTLTTMTNNTIRPMRVIRPVTLPDFLFTAVDAPLTPGPSGTGLNIYSRNVSFGTNALGQYYPGLAGPGTIETPTTVTFNKGVPVWFNYSGLDAYDPDRAEASSILFFYWGSFDGTTNSPVVYPNGTSLESIEGLATVDISPKSLPDGVVNQQYTPVQFSATGGVTPYTWSLAPGEQLPVGMTLSDTGILSGKPLYPATYGFIVRLTDAGGRIVDWPYSITIKRF